MEKTDKVILKMQVLNSFFLFLVYNAIISGFRNRKLFMGYLIQLLHNIFNINNYSKVMYQNENIPPNLLSG